MCGFIVSVFMFIMAAIACFMGAAVIVAVIVAAGLLISIKNYVNAKRMKASEMVCPNCGSRRIKIKREIAGISGNVVSTQDGDWSFGTSNHRVNRQRVAICKDCGFDYPYFTRSDVDASLKRAGGSLALWGFFAAAAVILFGSVYYQATTTGKDIIKDTADITIDSGHKPMSSQSAGRDILSPTPLEEFDYYLDGDRIVLKRYKGNINSIYPRTYYRVNGANYQTDLSEFSASGNRAEIMIIERGLKTINTSIFNSSDIQAVYFPKSLECIYDYTLSYLHPDEGRKIRIYYQGSEEDWNRVFKHYERTKVEDAKFGKELGTALADKINEMAGQGYDSSQFEFHFSTYPADMK